MVNIKYFEWLYLSEFNLSGLPFVSLGLLQHCHGILGQVQSGLGDALEPVLKGEVRILAKELDRS